MVEVRTAGALVGLLGGFALLAGCPQPAGDTEKTPPPQPFPRWCEDLGPLANAPQDINPERNWYLPATLTNLDMNQRLWSHDLGRMGELRLAYADNLIFYAGSEGYLGALDAKSGESIWELGPGSTKDRPSYYNPTVTPWSLTVVNRQQTVCELRFHDPLTGLLMRTEPLSFTAHRLLVAGGRISAIGGIGRVAAFSATSGERLNSTATVPLVLDPVATEERLILAGNDYSMYSLDLQTLAPLNFRILESPVDLPFIMGEDLLVFTDKEPPDILALNPHTLTTNWRAALDSKPNMLPAGHGDRIFFGEQTGLFRCFSTSDRRYLWTRDLEASCYVFMVFDNCTMAFADFELPRSASDEDAPPVEYPSWYESGHQRYHSAFVVDNDNGEILAQFPGSGELHNQFVTSYGIVALEGLQGPLICFPATITPQGSPQ